MAPGDGAGTAGSPDETGAGVGGSEAAGAAGGSEAAGAGLVVGALAAGRPGVAIGAGVTAAGGVDGSGAADEAGADDGTGVAAPWAPVPSFGPWGFVSAHWLPLGLAAISRPVARPGGKAPGACPSMGQRSPARGVKPTSTRPPGWNSMASASCAVASR